MVIVKLFKVLISRPGCVVAMAIIGMAMAGLQSCSSGQIEVVADGEVAAVDGGLRPALNVYVENSGSMDGYVSPDANLSDAVYSYVSRLGEYVDTTRLFYINSATIPYAGPLAGFIGDLTPEAFAAAGGNRSSSDMASMICRVLEATSDSTVTMFVSDCILDLSTSGGVSTSSQLNNRRIAISNGVAAALKRVPTLGIVVMKMESPFTGRYFYPDGRTTHLDGAARPYYIWLAGDRYFIARMLKCVPPINIVGNGFRELAGFTTETQVPFKVTNQSMNGSVVSSISGRYVVYLSADLGPTLQPSQVITSAECYSTTSPTPGLKIERVGAVTNPESPYDVFLEISIEEKSRIDMERIVFCPPSLPEWVERSDDSGISDVEGRLDRTVGLGALLQGVSEGFNNGRELTSFKFEIKRR